MKAIISLIAALVGVYFGNFDFWVTVNIVSLSIDAYAEWQNHTNDKTALQ